MKKQTTNKKLLVNKSDMDKIKQAVNEEDAVDVFRNKLAKLAELASAMLTAEVNNVLSADRDKPCKAITRQLNDMYEYYTAHFNKDAGADKSISSAVGTLLSFADSIAMIRLMYIPVRRNTNVLSFRVYIANNYICWCRIRPSRSKSKGTSVTTRFTN